MMSDRGTNANNSKPQIMWEKQGEQSENDWGGGKLVASNKKNVTAVVERSWQNQNH